MSWSCDNKRLTLRHPLGSSFHRVLLRRRHPVERYLHSGGWFRLVVCLRIYSFLCHCQVSLDKKWWNKHASLNIIFPETPDVFPWPLNLDLAPQDVVFFDIQLFVQVEHWKVGIGIWVLPWVLLSRKRLNGIPVCFQWVYFPCGPVVNPTLFSSARSKKVSK